MEIIELNAILYGVTFLYYFIRVQDLNIGGILLGLYFISSIFSILFYHHPIFGNTIHSSEVTIFPFIYLYIVLLLFFVPILRFQNNYSFTVSSPAHYKLKFFLWLIIIVSFVRVIYTLPNALTMLFSGADLAANKELIMSGENTVRVPFPLNILFVFSLLISKISVVLFFYIVSVKKFSKSFIWLFGLFAFSPDVLTGISDSSRAFLFGFTINVVFGYLLFKNSLPRRFKKKFLFFSLGVLALVISYVVSVTIMRFGDKLNTNIAFWQYKYFGESFVNFNGLLFGNLEGNTMGIKNFSFFREILGLNSFDELTEIRAYTNRVTGVPGYIFYLFVGHLIMDFGETIVFILSILNFLLFKNYFRINRRNQISLAKLIFLQFYFRLCFEGLFYFPYAMHIGNLQIMVYLVTFLFFRYDLKGTKLIKR